MPTTPLSVRKPHDITLKRVPSETVNAILAFAAEDHRSMAGQILHILEQYIQQRQTTKREH